MLAATIPLPSPSPTPTPTLTPTPDPASETISLVRDHSLATLQTKYQQTNINSPLPNEEWNSLSYFTAENDTNSVSKLILSGAQTSLSGNNYAGTSTGPQHTPLHIAARYGSVECMEMLIRGRVKINRKQFGNELHSEPPMSTTLPSVDAATAAGVKRASLVAKKKSAKRRRLTHS